MEKPVTFSVNGTQIVGILHLPEGAANQSPAVLFLHGFTGTKVEPHRIFVKTARALCAKGFACLRFDFRGWGDSGGESEESSMSTMVEDVKAATDFLVGQPNVDASRLGYLGFSTGGAAAALALAQHPHAKTIVLWNAVANGPQIIQTLATGSRVSDLALRGKADYNGNWIGRRFVEEFMVMRPVEALAKRPIPTLLIQAANDTQVNPTQVESYLQALDAKAARVEKVVMSEADHQFSSAKWEAEVIERTVGWFLTNL